MKKCLLAVLLLSSVCVFAANQSSQPVKKKYKTTNGELQNNPLAGSHQQSSEQQFGLPPVSGTKGKSYDHKYGPGQNNPLAGAHQQSSEQQFGSPPITGTKGVKPTHNPNVPKQANSPTVGGRQQSSDQVFGDPSQRASQ